ncbi:RNA polymerase sigma-70 factor [Xanthocytophaga flava]|uniref:RNA polymerase sigma-70 factor n=1 Tax=Xanthocytophaga flava TaxID=3048013 RepID=UPI0028D60AD0|nr:RNA polymerase sigma-70 factor [Xanthocytophaga flavus]MDJ1470282.1 RNA polymerase sigma-70 factor [Xanthocytophaga flavus]
MKNGIADHALVLEINKGNRLAFNQLYERYWRRLLNYSFNILNDSALAEDTVQEVFIRIWENKEQIENVKAYLFKACRNRSISQLRKDHFSELQEAVIAVISAEPEALMQFNVEDLKEKIEAAAAELPPKCREIFYMSRFEHYSIQEIAEQLNISPRTVENNLTNALKHIRQALPDTIYLVVLMWLL